MENDPAGIQAEARRATTLPQNEIHLAESRMLKQLKLGEYVIEMMRVVYYEDTLQCEAVHNIDHFYKSFKHITEYSTQVSTKDAFSLALRKNPQLYRFGIGLINHFWKLKWIITSKQLDLLPFPRIDPRPKDSILSHIADSLLGTQYVKLPKRNAILYTLHVDTGQSASTLVDNDHAIETYASEAKKFFESVTVTTTSPRSFSPLSPSPRPSPSPNRMASSLSCPELPSLPWVDQTASMSTASTLEMVRIVPKTVEYAWSYVPPDPSGKNLTDSNVTDNASESTMTTKGKDDRENDSDSDSFSSFSVSSSSDEEDTPDLADGNSQKTPRNSNPVKDTVVIIEESASSPRSARSMQHGRSYSTGSIGPKPGAGSKAPPAKNFMVLTKVSSPRETLNVPVLQSPKKSKE